MIVYANGKTLGTDKDGETSYIGSTFSQGLTSISTADEKTRSLLSDILKEMRIMNLHMASITDTYLENEDVK